MKEGAEQEEARRSRGGADDSDDDDDDEEDEEEDDGDEVRRGGATATRCAPEWCSRAYCCPIFTGAVAAQPPHKMTRAQGRIASP